MNSIGNPFQRNIPIGRSTKTIEKLIDLSEDTLKNNDHKQMTKFWISNYDTSPNLLNGDMKVVPSTVS